MDQDTKDRIRIVELIKKASFLSGIPASEIHRGKGTPEISFIRMVIAYRLRVEGMKVSLIAKAFNRSEDRIYKLTNRMRVPGVNASWFLEELLRK